MLVREVINILVYFSAVESLKLQVLDQTIKDFIMFPDHKMMSVSLFLLNNLLDSGSEQVHEQLIDNNLVEMMVDLS